METRIGKIDAAVSQIDWAIALAIDHGEFVSAITLAGAAEEILGSAVGDEAAFYKLKASFLASHSLDPKILTQHHLNRAKNWLKHWDPPTEPEYDSFELEQEAAQQIVRAIANLVTYDRSIPSNGPRFFAWIATLPSDTASGT